MKLLTYIHNGSQIAGALAKDGSRVFSFADLGFGFTSMQELIDRHTPEDLAEMAKKLESPDGGVPFGEISLLAPIPHPKHDIICIGMNYLEHAIEAAKFLGLEYTKPPYPVYFSKRVDMCVPSGGFIPSHADITSRLDYECELAVVMGSNCSHASEDDVYGHIFGYTIVNDVSARDMQNKHQQYMFSKSLDGFAPMGPFIVTKDEIGWTPLLNVRTRVNGEPRQDGNTGSFIFTIPELISQLSAGITLEAGDIIITGTPAGVGAGFDPPRFLKPGDVVECEIDGIGTLVNTVK